MTAVWILCALALILAALALYRVYCAAFRVGMPVPAREVPRGAAFDPYRGEMLANIDRLLALEWEPMSVRSRDGLLLKGSYYAGAPGAPLLLFFHGFRSSAHRDGSGGFWYCREKGYGILLADQRGHGKSEGRALTFGIRERYDCLAWAEEAVRCFGPEVRILLAGVSMGASTVLSAAELPLPEQVKGIWADCGFSSAAGVLEATARRRRLPVGLMNLLARWSAAVFAGFHLGESSPLEAVGRTKLPILLVHGEADSLVPVEMACALRDACAGEATLLTVPGAEHGMSWYADNGAYRRALDKFCDGIFRTAPKSGGDAANG